MRCTLVLSRTVVAAALGIDTGLRFSTILVVCVICPTSKMTSTGANWPAEHADAALFDGREAFDANAERCRCRGQAVEAIAAIVLRGGRLLTAEQRG